jgi:hypothetical protein
LPRDSKLGQTENEKYIRVFFPKYVYLSLVLLATASQFRICVVEDEGYSTITGEVFIKYLIRGGCRLTIRITDFSTSRKRRVEVTVFGILS